MVTPLRSRSERTPPQSPVKVEGAEVGAGSERWPSAQARAPQPAADVHQRRARHDEEVGAHTREALRHALPQGPPGDEAREADADPSITAAPRNIARNL